MLRLHDRTRTLRYDQEEVRVHQQAYWPFHRLRPLDQVSWDDSVLLSGCSPVGLPTGAGYSSTRRKDSPDGGNDEATCYGRHNAPYRDQDRSEAWLCGATRCREFQAHGGGCARESVGG